MNITLLLSLVMSHILADFYLQPNSWIKAKFEKKHKAWQLYAHALVAGILAYCASFVTGSCSYWWIIPAVAIPHFFIDLWKVNTNGSSKYFVIDQLLHFVTLLIIWLGVTQAPSLLFNYGKVFFRPIALIGSGILLLWQPTGILIGKLTEVYRENLDDEDKSTSLPLAGKAIGVLERLFIFTLILSSQFTAIGFLIAAKSILRFSDHKDVKNPVRMSEYVIIGTLMSFLIAVVVSLIVKALL